MEKEREWREGYREIGIGRVAFNHPCSPRNRVACVAVREPGY